MCSGPSRPPRLRPQGFSPSRRFPRKPGLRGPRPARLRAGLHAATVQDLVSPSGLHPQESRAPLEAAGSLVVSVGAAFECDPSCPDLPGLPPTPASFRPTFTRGAECDLVRPRVRQTSARWPVSLQGSNDVSSRAEAHESSSPAGTANRAHPRVAPSTSERSSSRVPDSLPRRRHRFVGRDPRGVLPSRAFLRLRPRALTDLPGCLPQWGTGRALEMRYAWGCAPRVGSAAPPVRALLETARRIDLSAAQTLRRLRRATSR